MARRSCRVLVVDDEPAVREVLQARLEQWGFPVSTASTVQIAKSLITTFDPHVVISDLVLPDATGISLLEQIRAQSRDRTVLLITAYGTIDTAVQAIKAGAAEFLTKPLDYVTLRRQLEEIDQRIARNGNDDRQSLVSPSFETPGEDYFGMVGHSAPLRAMQQQIQTAAVSDAPVLIVGESGSGKELVARTIHQLSQRKIRTFVPVNAAAIPESLVEAEFFGVERGALTGATQSRPGFFEEAHCGTLFLDEVTEMPQPLQPKFLRVLEDGNVRRVGGRAEMTCDVRLIAATNRDPLQAVQEGRLRMDLFYRIDVLRIDVPPLRERKEDIPALVFHFLRQVAARSQTKERSQTPEPSQTAIPSVTQEAFARLAAYHWPGNVRELKNWVARAFARAPGGTIEAEHVLFEQKQPAEPSAPSLVGIVIPHGVTAAEAERILILETLRATGNIKAETARRLGLDVKTIRNKLKLFDPGENHE